MRSSCSFNGDRNADLAVADGSGSHVSILLGNGDGTFHASVEYPAGGAAAYVGVGDFRGDGKPDLAVALGSEFGCTATGLSILLGNGDGTFQHPVNDATVPPTLWS